jgi:hypothetical protein
MTDKTKKKLRWKIVDLSNGEEIFCENKREVFDTLYRPLIEKFHDPCEFEVYYGKTKYDLYLTLGLTKIEG